MAVRDLDDYPWDAVAPYARQAAEHPGGLVDLSIGSPVDPTPSVVADALRNATDAHGYPQTVGTPALREAIAAWYDRRRGVPGLRGADVLPTVGSKELVALLPLLLIAVAIVVTDGFPVLFRQTRVGRGGREFTLLKFRSMRGAPRNASGGFEPGQTSRVTGIGKLLRRTKLDELPQLLNVIRGDMSVVGPRPQVRREVDTYDDLVSHRLAVKPGLTGLWQISGRSDLEAEDAIRLDLTYVENWSLSQDILIILKTIRTVLTGDGAY